MLPTHTFLKIINFFSNFIQKGEEEFRYYRLLLYISGQQYFSS